ncbi:MAG: hypothetical protein ACKOSS_00145, partial [Planctomycetia bacterium]
MAEASPSPGSVPGMPGVPAAKRPLRIVHLAPGGWPRIGGGQLLSTRVAEGLALRGHAVHMVAAADARPAAGREVHDAQRALCRRHARLARQ